MQLSKYQTPAGPRWAVDGKALPPHFSLSLLLELPASAIAATLTALSTDALSTDSLSSHLPPVDAIHEIDDESDRSILENRRAGILAHLIERRAERFHDDLAAFDDALNEKRHRAAV